MEYWVEFLTAFPQPGEIHTWLLNKTNYLDVYSFFAVEHNGAQHRHSKGPIVMPHSRSRNDENGISSPYRVPSTARNTAMRGLITIRRKQGNTLSLVAAFGSTPRVVMQQSGQMDRYMVIARGCRAAGLIVQPAVRGCCVRIFHHHRSWFIATNKHIAHQRQPLSSLPTRVRSVLTCLSAVITHRTNTGARLFRDTPCGPDHFWGECQRCLTTDQVWFFMVTEDDFYFSGSYPILHGPPVKMGQMDPNPPTNQEKEPLFRQNLPFRTGDETDDETLVNTLKYNTPHVGTIVYNPVTLATLIITLNQYNFILYRLIDKKETVRTLVARLIFLTRILWPLRPDVVDIATQKWITGTIKPFLSEHAEKLWPKDHGAIQDATERLFTQIVPGWVANVEKIPDPDLPQWICALLAVIARPGYVRWLPLWEGELWVRLLVAESGN